MERSETAVMLASGSQALPPVWLCRRCWVVLPVGGEQLHLERLGTARGA